MARESGRGYLLVRNWALFSAVPRPPTLLRVRSLPCNFPTKFPKALNYSVVPRLGSGRCHIPDTKSVPVRRREACLSCGCQLIGLLGSGFAVVPDRGSVFHVFSSISTLIRAIETDLGTAYCQAYCRSCKIVFLVFRFLSYFPPNYCSKMHVIRRFVIRTTFSNSLYPVNVAFLI